MSLAADNKAFDSKAAAFTAIIHVILLLLFFFITYQVPATQEVVEMGMEVNIGTDADGFGTQQRLVSGVPAPNDASNVRTSSSRSSSLPQQMLQSDDEDAPAVYQTNRNNTSTTRNDSRNNRTNSRSSNDRNTANNTRTQQRDPRYVYNGSQGTGGNGSPVDAAGGSEGNTTGNGDRGVPNGTPGADNYTGTPGTGNNFSLNGRTLIKQPGNIADYNESGKVVVHITVNRAGTVTSKRVVSSSNAKLSKIALEKTDELRYNKSTSAPVEQSANITFVFKTRS